MVASQPEYSPEELHELLSGLMPEIPGYRVLRLLGRGGMSYVYLGVQQSLDRQVAIKVIQPEALRDEISKLRFEREAQIIAKLQHPCIVGIYEIGRTEHGLLYYVLPYLARGHLGQRDLRGDPHGIVEVLRALLWALDYAHGRGVVHRDVKAENVLFDNADRPLLTDFGIALSRRDRSRVTGRGLAVGSGAHMAPEQARGESVDGRADLYSLGVLTYEMLTGYLPYRNSDPLGLALMHAVDPVPPLPEGLAHWQPLLDKAMAKQPAERFSDAREMMVALDAVEAAMNRQGLPTPAASLTRQSWLALGNWARSARERHAAKEAAAGSAGPALAPPAASQQTGARSEPTATREPAPVRPWKQALTAQSAALAARLRHSQAHLRRRLAASGRAAGAAAFAVAVAVLVLLGLWAGWPVGETVEPTADPAPVSARPAIAAAPAPSPAEAPAAATPGPVAPPVAHTPGEAPALETGGTPSDTPAGSADEGAMISDPLAELSADARLLAFAEEQIKRRRLSQPPGDNAYESLLAAEALSADPARLSELGDAWIEAATPYVVTALEQGRDEAALALLQRGRELAARLSLQSSSAATALREAVSTPLNTTLAALHRAGDAKGLRALKARIRFLGLPGERFEPYWSRPLLQAQVGDTVPGAPGWQLLRLPEGDRPGLAMQARAVTRDAYARFADESGRAAASCRIRTAVVTLRKRSWQAPEFAQQGDHPVVCVSLADARAYAAWESQRLGQAVSLPSPALWQAHAATASTRCASEQPCTIEGTTAAAAGARSATGVISARGNVREWLDNGTASGESWRDLAEPRNPRREAGAEPTRGYDDVGFRLVREVPRSALEVPID